jgi:small redox-active disulfide protein 2
MKIQILGVEPDECRQLALNTNAAIKELKLPAEIEIITDINQILSMGILVTPAITIDGAVKNAGFVADKDKIIQILNGIKKTLS